MKSLRWIIAIVLGLLLLAMSPATTATAHKKGSADGAVVEHWNAIAVRTIFAENATPIPSSQLYFGFVSSAVHDAVRKAERANRRQGRHSPRASVVAAAATAAHDVLVEYFSASATRLAGDLAADLTEVPDRRRKERGIDIGESAAAAVIADRVGDGRPPSSIVLDVVVEPGVWRPTPPANLPMAVPWLGFVEPLLLDSPTAQPAVRSIDP